MPLPGRPVLSFAQGIQCMLRKGPSGPEIERANLLEPDVASNRQGSTLACRAIERLDCSHRGELVGRRPDWLPHWYQPNILNRRWHDGARKNPLLGSCS